MKTLLTSAFLSLLLSSTAFADSTFNCTNFTATEWKGQIKLTTGETVPVDVQVEVASQSPHSRNVKTFVGTVNSQQMNMDTSFCEEKTDGYRITFMTYDNNYQITIDRPMDNSDITVLKNLKGTIKGKQIDPANSSITLVKQLNKKM